MSLKLNCDSKHIRAKFPRQECTMGQLPRRYEKRLGANSPPPSLSLSLPPSLALTPPLSPFLSPLSLTLLLCLLPSTPWGERVGWGQPEESRVSWIETIVVKFLIRSILYSRAQKKQNCKLFTGNLPVESTRQWIPGFLYFREKMSLCADVTWLSVNFEKDGHWPHLQF